MSFQRRSIFAALALMSPPLIADTLWVPGVSIESGWIDYEKTIQKGDGDDNLCWAASSANIIDYWQQLYVTPSNAPTGEAIWTTFKEACTVDTGGNLVYAMQWWLGGDYQGSTRYDDSSSEFSTRINDRAYWVTSERATVPITTNIDEFSGYYWELIPSNYPNSYNYYNYGKVENLRDFILYCGPRSQNDANVSLEEIQMGLSAGAPLSLGLNDTNNRLSHAITLWGIEYDETGLKSIWITDSDDYQHQLRNVEVTYKEGDSITLYLSGYSNYSGYGDIYISSYSGINVAESNTWNLTPAIPEYTSAVLSLLALSALGMRRRRK